MKRVLEPEVMEDEAQAAAYAAADFSSSNQMFVDGLLERYGTDLRTVLDIGCGPGDVPIRLARTRPSIQIAAVDASDAMVSLAERAVQRANLANTITVLKGRVPGLRFEGRDFDAIVSKDLLHHLPDPMVFWDEVKRLARARTVVYVMDLFRPASENDAADIVESVSANEPETLRRDFYNSLLAALTVQEVQEQIERAGLALKVAAVSERHLLVEGLIE